MSRPCVAGSSMKTSVAWCIPCDRQKRWLETRPFVCRRVDLRCRISDAIWMPFKGLRLINPIFEADIYRALCFASLGILRVCFFRSYLRLGRKKAVRSYQLSEATWTLVKPYQTSLFGHRLPICYAFLAVLISCCAHSGLAPVILVRQCCDNLLEEQFIKDQRSTTCRSYWTIGSYLRISADILKQHNWKVISSQQRSHVFCVSDFFPEHGQLFGLHLK